MVDASLKRLSMWTYPWDVQDLSADKVGAELRDAGVDTISLAASYHAGRFLQARSPRRKTFRPEDGTIYFEPTPSRWSDRTIRPQVAALVSDGGDVLADLVRRRDAGGLGVACWTVCLHNSRLGRLHPGSVTRNCFDEPSGFALCPSQPAVRDYVATLVEDLSASYRPDAIELESVGFMGWAHGHHHEKDGVGLQAEDDLLLSLCFCPVCLERAARAGVDGARAQTTARSLIEAALARPVPEPRWPDLAIRGPEALSEHREVLDYLLWRQEPVASLVAEIRERADPATSILVIDAKDGWLGGCDLRSVAAACDGAILCGYDMEPAAIAAMIRDGRAAVGPDRFLGAALRLFYPEMSGPRDVAERSASALGAGCDGLAFYNYGLVPHARLDWVHAALEPWRRS